jgi:uncharacterized damage-inducible protein DinB
MNDPRYPIGKFVYEGLYSPDQRKAFIEQIALLPQRMREAVAGLTDEQLLIPYREGGWNIRQVVHHTADSHANGYIRAKLALTEENPTIKPYEEALWAELPDTWQLPIEVSLTMLEMTHLRWVKILESLNETQWQRTFYHPELKQSFLLEMQLGLYAWHGNHHLGHIQMVTSKL